jgi:UDP-N-acetylglucosamine 2-epimerase
MSQVFFEELTIPEPNVNLAVGSASHGKQTGQKLIGLPVSRSLIGCWGDTNSTLAGALAAVKRHVPVVHVEVGLRSAGSPILNRRLASPEKIRVLGSFVDTVVFAARLINIKNPFLFLESIPLIIKQLDTSVAFFLEEAINRRIDELILGYCLM